MNVSTTASGGEAAAPSPTGLAKLGSTAAALGKQFTDVGNAIHSGFTQPLLDAYANASAFAEQLNRLGEATAAEGGRLSGAQQEAQKLAASLGILSQATGKIRPDIQAQITSALAVGEAWSQFKNELMLVAVQILGAVGPALVQMIHALHPLITMASSLASWFSHLGGGTQEMVVAIGAAVAIFGGLMTVVGSVLAAVAALVAVIGVIGAPVVATVAAVAAAIAAGVAAWLMWGDELTSFFQGVVQSVSGWWAGLVETVRSHLLAIATAVHAGLDSLMAPLANLEDFLANRLGAAIVGWWQTVKDVFSSLPGIIGGALEQALAVVADVVMNQIPAAFVAGWNLVAGTVADFGAYLAEAIPAALDAVLSAAVDFGAQLWSIVGNAIDGALEIFNDLKTWLFEDLPNVLRGIPAQLSSWAESVIGWVKYAIDSAVAALSALPDYIQNHLLSDLMGVGKQLWQALVHGVFQAIRSSVGAASEIVEWFEGVLGPDVAPTPQPSRRIAAPQAPHALVQPTAPAQQTAPRQPAAPNPPPRAAVPSGAGSHTTTHRTHTTVQAHPTVRGAAALSRTPISTPAAVAVASTDGMRAAPVTTVVTTPVTGYNVQLGGVSTPAAAGAGTGAQPQKTADPTFFGKVMKVGHDAMDSFKGSVVNVMGQFTPLGIVAEFLGDVMKGLQPAIDSLKAPLKLVATLFGAALSPILKAIFPIFKMVAIAATFVAQIFFTVVGGLAKFIGGVIAGIGKLIGKIPGLGGLGKKIKKAGEGIQDMGKGMLESAEQMKKGRKELQEMEFGDTAEGMQKLNEQLTNAPEGFKVALERFQAMAPQQATLPGAGGNGGGGDTGDESYGGSAGGGGDGDLPQGGRGKHITIGNVQIVSNNPEEIWKKLKRVMERENNRTNGSMLTPALT
jgi:hypothetical protein